jgi:hypothetical protein
MGLLVTALAHLHVRKRTEGRAPEWGPEFTGKAATIQGGSEEIALMPNKEFCDVTSRWCVASSRPCPLKKNHYPSQRNCCRWLFGGAAGRAGAMCAIAPCMPPHVCPRENRRRLPQRCYAAGEVTNFALVAIYGLNNDSVCPLQGRRRPTPRFCAAGVGGMREWLYE